MKHLSELNKQKAAYESTFRIENILRVSMHNIMADKKGVDYFDKNSLPEYEYPGVKVSGKINVVHEAKQRKGTERKYNLALGYDYPFFWYLDFPVLISLIDVFWEKYFHRMFNIGTNKVKNEVLSRLKGVVSIRNAVAHHRYLSNVDVSDLESCYKVLIQHLSEDYTRGFGNIALNPLEGVVREFVASCQEVKTLIAKSKYVDKDKVPELKGSFSAIVSATNIAEEIRLFEEILALIQRYNRLPRKPGRGPVIESFKQETNILEKITSLSDLVGGYV